MDALSITILVATLLIAITALGVSILNQRHTVRVEYVRSLEQKLQQQGRTIEDQERRIKHLEDELAKCQRENHEILLEIHDLRQGQWRRSPH
jgi:septal ring factor EnvC (AmiA/AmiB activator)